MASASATAPASTPVSTSDKEKVIKLQSNDDKVFEVNLQVAKMSFTIKTMLEDLGLDEDESEAVPLPNVRGEILKKIIEWCEYHKDDPEPEKEEEDEFKEKRTDDICFWDVNFLKVEQSELFDIVLAANYLDIKGLLLVCCKTIAGMLKGKTPDEIRKTFNIVNDLSEEQIAKIRKENAWTEEK